MKFPLLGWILMVDAAGDLSLEEGKCIDRVRGLLYKLSSSDFLQNEPLQIRALLPGQLQPPEVSQPQFPVPVLLPTRVPAKHEVDSDLLVKDQLMSVARPGLDTLPPLPVLRLTVLISIDHIPSTSGDLVNPETVADLGTSYSYVFITTLIMKEKIIMKILSSSKLYLILIESRHHIDLSSLTVNGGSLRVSHCRNGVGHFPSGSSI